MIEETVFLGLSEIIWQGIFGFLSTIIVAGAVGFISIHWLSKQEALNEREGKILNDRITAYLEILDSMARINERTIVLDAELDIRRELEKHGIVTLKDRAAVEYPPFFESREKFHAILKSLDDFYINKLHLVGPKSYKEFIYVYLYMSKLDGYYKYLMTTPMPDGTLLDERVADEILEDFLPKLGVVIDFDMVKMQADFERALVGELYKLKSCTKPPLRNEVKQAEFFYGRFSETLYAINEIGIFQLLIDVMADKIGTPYQVLSEHLQANDLVMTPFLHDQEVS
ncbi:hypothetical protein [Clostridiisalibacter paucivorans]|uniref:hypothetical protein n=1 Tax=Clostridiisalibacter paucivorans TaxID=408753 RepID=UPI00047AD006|nr:hypothetical protein [Clostridiisalibacter paucivorans]